MVDETILKSFNFNNFINLYIDAFGEFKDITPYYIHAVLLHIGKPVYLQDLEEITFINKYKLIYCLKFLYNNGMIGKGQSGGVGRQMYWAFGRF